MSALDPRRWLLALALVLPLALAGCGGSVVDEQGNQLGSFQVVDNGNGTATVKLTPTGGCGGQGGDFEPAGTTPPAAPPPNLNGPGNSGESPSAPVVGEDVQGEVNRIAQEYGFRVSGSAVTRQNLQNLLDGISVYPRSHYDQLAQVELIDRGRPIGSGDVAGTWAGPSARRSNLPRGRTFDTQVGIRLYAFRPRAGGASQIFSYAATHEFGHHVNELEDGTTFGRDFYNALSQSSGPFATPYARSNDADFVAEGLSVMLLGNQARPLGPIEPSFNPSPQARSLVQQTFGRLGPGL